MNRYRFTTDYGCSEIVTLADDLGVILRGTEVDLPIEPVDETCRCGHPKDSHNKLNGECSVCPQCDGFEPCASCVAPWVRQPIPSKAVPIEHGYLQVLAGTNKYSYIPLDEGRAEELLNNILIDINNRLNELEAERKGK